RRWRAAERRPRRTRPRNTSETADDAGAPYPARRSTSFDQVVRAEKNSLRYRQAEIMRRLEIDREAKTRGQLQRQVGRLGAAQDPIRQVDYAIVFLAFIRRIG